MENPYFAVTDADGTFAIAKVPPGDYTLAVWHEKLGEQKQQIHVDASGSVTVDFAYR